MKPSVFVKKNLQKKSKVMVKMVNKRIRVREKNGLPFHSYLEHFPNLCWDEIIFSPIAYQVSNKQAYT